MIKEPSSMDGLVYFTRQSGKQAKVVAWVRKMACPKCKKPMGKPVEKGKVRVRASVYVCPGCGYEEQKQEHFDKLTAEITYNCNCGHNGEQTLPFKRKKIKVYNDGEGKEVGVDALVFPCSKCKERIIVAKKMKV